MKHWMSVLFLLCSYAAGLDAAAAQQSDLSLPPVAPAPVAAVPAAASFPPLPPSRPCRQQDLVGLWKLQNIYEVPAGPEMTAFAASPVQYLLFKSDSIYGRYNAGTAELSPEIAIDRITKHTTGLQQYLGQESGFVYFYQDSIAIDTQACFIVANAVAPFMAGQMLMMPPQGQIPGRLVKIYAKIASLPTVVQPVPQVRPQQVRPKQTQRPRPKQVQRPRPQPQRPQVLPQQKSPYTPGPPPPTNR